MDGAALVPQAAAVLSAYEAHFSQEYGQQRVQGINLAKVSSQRQQGCGSVPIHLIRIQHFRLNNDPDPDPIRIQGFDEQKIFFIKNCNLPYLFLGLHQRRPSYRKSLQPSKEDTQHEIS